MASRLLTRHAVYMRNFQAVVKHFRAFSSYSEGPEMGNATLYDDSASFTVWPDEKLGPFAPQDKRFPLPGRVGAIGKSQKKSVVEPVDPEMIFKTLPSERHGEVLEQALQIAINHEEEQLMSENTVLNPSDHLECVAHQCPLVMRKDFADLFPERRIMYGDFTVITISQKTEEDMTGWSEEVEVEREELLKTFVEGANEICEALRAAGFWADFIDPSSGKPYLGPHTPATLFETDERYRKLGFEIDDLGCCKVIRHHIWGTHSYIGCIFTNAPTTDPIIDSMKKT